MQPHLIINFLKDLAANNNREWFHENKKRYEKEVKKPFASFTERVLQAIGEFDKPMPVKPSSCIFRINRDTRFSADKSPYKLHVAANFTPHGSSGMGYPGYYMHFGIEESFVGGGVYAPDKAAIDAIRNYMMENRAEYEQAISGQNFVDKYGTIKGESNKRLNAPFKELFFEFPSIALKQFYFMKDAPVSDMTEDELFEYVIEHFKAGKEVNLFLRRALRID